MGGYFITKGLERIVRMLIMPRRNYPAAMKRGAFTKRGATFSEYGVRMRCVRPDQTSSTVVLHYLTDGTASLRIVIRRREYFIPLGVLLLAVDECSDREVFRAALQGDESNTFLRARLEMLLRQRRRFDLHTRDQALAFLGSRFRVALRMRETASDEEVGRALLRGYVLVHLNGTAESGRDKWVLLVHMLRKLCALVEGRIMTDEADSQANQEILLAGHVFSMLFKDNVVAWCTALRRVMQRDVLDRSIAVSFADTEWFDKCISKVNKDIGRAFEYFLSTGNLVSAEGIDLPQVSGFTIVAEKLNFLRYLAHFRCVHRGAYFTEMRTTAVRKLLPEGWGFLCPVHTPDGGPCGLLLHLSAQCRIVTQSDVSGGATVTDQLLRLGVVAAGSDAPPPGASSLPVLLDGRVVGYLAETELERVERELRRSKVAVAGGSGSGSVVLPSQLEVVAIRRPTHGRSLFPGLYLFTSPARMMRQVHQLESGAAEYIGSFEQMFLDVACQPPDVIPGVTTHQDFTPMDMLSVVAQLTPFSDLNQSPRNMYQCQMGKQTMAVPTHTYAHRNDNVLYRVMTPQSPMVATEVYDKYGMDLFPMGTNSIVAVVSFTGYDMEDAMIINKMSYERGFMHGVVYKTKLIDLAAGRAPGDPVTKRFGNTDESGNLVAEGLGEDGLPIVGAELRKGMPLYATTDVSSGAVRVTPYKGMEEAHIERVSLIASGDNTEVQFAVIVLRYTRNPIIGDKFSSRHGQKGTLAQLWPGENMPISESGMQPDIIINPHAFPSRMTIGMLVESMAGKSGALHGKSRQNATPWLYDDSRPAVDEFGRQLVAAGFNYHGNEPMYSGITGDEFEADIFMGVVYYQRLRHMVSDKYQVRATGAVHELTHQPVKGRKRAGGVRFGEMERDALLAHGVAFLARDRLMNCSDSHRAYVCAHCGSM
jgi:DNA-directed RNA polymerase I subunit RPA2